MSLPATVNPQHVGLWEVWMISITDIEPFTLQTGHVADPEETLSWKPWKAATGLRG